MGLDTLGGRPTVLWALAISRLPAKEREELLRVVHGSLPASQRVTRVRALYCQADVFAQADQLISTHQASALAIASEIQPPCLQNLLHYLVDTVLMGATSPEPTVSQFGCFVEWERS